MKRPPLLDLFLVAAGALYFSGVVPRSSCCSLVCSVQSACTPYACCAACPDSYHVVITIVIELPVPLLEFCWQFALALLVIEDCKVLLACTEKHHINPYIVSVSMFFRFDSPSCSH